MRCPYCQSEQVFVTNSRSTKSFTQTWRRRHCLACGSVFTTHEIIDLSHLIVIKKSGKREKFAHAKLFSGVYGAASGFSFPHKEKVLDHFVEELESHLLSLKKKEITSQQIADLVLDHLLDFHAGIFLRFLAYCHHIKTKADIQKELVRYL